MFTKFIKEYKKSDQWSVISGQNFIRRKLVTNHWSLSTKRGFTIIEMIIVSGIFAVLTAIIIFKYGDFNSRILVTNMAYEVAIATRQAQIFGLGARGFKTTDENQFEFPYGIFFNLHDGSTGKEEETKRFSLFVDLNKDKLCSNQEAGGDCNCIDDISGQVDECVEELVMTQGIRITELRTNYPGTYSCNVSNIYKIAVSFKRPSPEAIIVDQSNPRGTYDFLQIKVQGKSANIDPTYVLIRRTGQISVSQNDICAQSGNGDTNDNLN